MSKAEELREKMSKAFFEIETSDRPAIAFNQGYDKGYRQAEKDLALTWEDIKLISEIGEEYMNSEDSDDFWENEDEEKYYNEILKRFLKEKNKV